MRRTSSCILLTCFVMLVVGMTARGADWPTYLHDRARSGITQETLTTPLRPVWTFNPVVPPDPAWTEPAKEAARVRFDDAFHIVAAAGRAYFASSGDNKVYALDAASGRILWSFFTEGPVRLAPTIALGRLYFGSDDGFAYCLAADTGRLIWKVRAAYSDDRVIGHGRIMSLWPVRTGVLVDDGVAYFGAGVFPSESIYICAADAETGKILWRNDVAGEFGPEQQYDGISPQGYLLCSNDTLYVASGRSMPAGFARKDGKFLFNLAPGGKVGGTYALLTDEHLVAGVNEQRVYDQKTGKTASGAYAWAPAHRLIVTKGMSYSLEDHQLVALDRTKHPQIAKERAVSTGERQKVRAELRTLTRRRYRLNKDDATYQAEYDALTAKIAPLLARVKTLDAELAAIENKSYKWKRDNDLLDSMILAGDVLFVGGRERVIAVDTETGKWTWTGTIDGRASALAVSDGRLFVSTNTGRIQCFAQGTPRRVRAQVSPEVKRYPFADDARRATYARAADRIVADTGVRIGFCVVLGCGEGRLAFELAQRTDLRIYCVDPDAGKVAKARAALDAAGLYGKRVTVDLGSLARLPYPNYIANLIVSDDLLATGKVEASPEEVYRVLRPSGGVVYLGQPAGRDGLAGAVDGETLTAWLRRAGGEAPVLSRDDGVWAKLTRGPLAGAGDWTHQYANPANTTNSGDHQVQTPMGVQWFGRPGPERMIERHGRAAAPLYYQGRLFTQGENVVMAHDAYNGTELWTREIAGAIRPRADLDGSNMAITENGLFVGARDGALRLDPATGETVTTYAVVLGKDGAARRWGWLATVGRTLYGTSAPPLREEYGARWQNVSEDPIDNLNAFRRFNAGGGMWRRMQRWPDWGREDSWRGGLTPQMLASDKLFALNIDTGQPRWVREGRIGHCTISIAEGVLFFADSNVTAQEKKDAVAARRAKYGKLIDEEEEIESYQDYDVRRLVAVDAVTGETKWERIVDLTGSGGDRLGTAVHEGALLIFGHFSNHDGGAWAKGGLKWRRVTVLDAASGADRWSKPLNYLRRPLVLGDELIVEPRAVNLRTGEFRMRYHPITGETVPWEFKRGGHSCGITTGSAYTFFLRSYSINYYDMQKDTGMLPFGGVRAGCWINMIPAGGLALIPEASAGCTCSFPIRSTVVMAPKPRDRAWTVYVQPGAMTPVKHWFVNLGAPGDRKDASGNLWFGYPRLRLGYGVRFKLEQQTLAGMGPYARSYEGEPIARTDVPWVFTSGIAGLTSCKLPLLEKDQGPADYTVRLGFAEPRHDAPGKRVFTIKLQGKVVAENFDIHQAARGRNVALVKAFADVRVHDALTIELVPSVQNPTQAQAPLLNSIEVHRQE